MNLRDKFKNSIASATLATLVACTGGGSNPKPTPKLTVTGSIVATPSPLESNDAITYKMTASTNISDYTTPNAATIRTIYLDIDGDGTYDQSWPGNGTNSIEKEITGLALIVQNPTNYHPVLKVEYDNVLATGTPLASNTFSGSYTVNPEKNGYIASYADSKAYLSIPANRTKTCDFLATANLGDIGTSTEFDGVFTKGLDTIDIVSNYEIKQIVINDRDKQFGIVFTNNTGYVTAWSNMTPEQNRIFDEIRTGLNAKQP